MYRCLLCIIKRKRHFCRNEYISHQLAKVVVVLNPRFFCSVTPRTSYINRLYCLTKIRAARSIHDMVSQRLKTKDKYYLFLADQLLYASTAILRSSNLHFSNARSSGFRLRQEQKVTESKIMFCNHRFSSQPCPFIPKKIRVDASATNFSLKPN